MFEWAYPSLVVRGEKYRLVPSIEAGFGERLELWDDWELRQLVNDLFWEDVTPVATIASVIPEFAADGFARTEYEWKKRLVYFLRSGRACLVPVQVRQPVEHTVAVPAQEEEQEAPASAPRVAPTRTFIEIEAVDHNDDPIVRLDLAIRLPSSSRVTAATNRQGLTRVDRIDEGMCEVAWSDPPHGWEEWDETTGPGTDWIEVHLVDAQDNSVAGVSYKLKVPNGDVRKGQSDGKGIITARSLTSGSCKLEFDPPQG